MTTEIKKLQFVNGVNVTAPADLTSASSTTHLGEYVDDAAYVAANGTAVGGDTYINTTFKCVRIFTGSAWRNHIVASNAADATKTFEVDISGNTTSVKSTLDFNDTANAVHTVPAGTNTLAVYPINQASEVTGVLPLANGGTGQTSASTAINALVPTQSGNIGKFLSTDGTVVLWQDGGSGGGSGSGEINAVLNPNDANAGWNGGTSHTTTGIPTGGPLSPVIETAIRISATASTTESSTSGGGYTITTMPDPLFNKKLKLQFYYKTPATTSWAVSVYKGATRTSLSSDVAGVTTLPANVEGSFTAYLDTDATATYNIRFTRIAGSGTTQLDLTNVIVGPGIQANSAIVGQLVPWTPFTSWAPNATWTGNWRQVGQLVEYFVEGSFTNTTSSGVLDVDLPAGHVISSALFKGPSGTLSTISSSGSVFNGSTAVHRVSVNVLDSDTVRVVYASTAADQFANLDSSGSPVTIGAGSTIRFEFKLPIVAFEGAGTININTPDVEYIYNTNLTDTNNSTSFGYGAEGIVFGNFTAQRFQRVRSKYAIGPSDKIELQITTNSGASWTSYEQGSLISPRTIQNSVNYGAFIAAVNATDIDVYFADYRATLGATYGSAGSPWSDIDNDPQYKWRVAIHRGPSPVGFAHVTQEQSGLVKRAGQLLGTNTDDSAEVGYVGQTITAFTTSNPGNMTNGAFYDYLTITLTPGEWELKSSAVFSASVAITSLLRVLHGISTTVGFSDLFGVNTAAYLPSGQAMGAGGGSAIFSQVVSGTTYKIPFGTTQDVKLIAYVEYAGGQFQITDGIIQATRIR